MTACKCEPLIPFSIPLTSVTWLLASSAVIAALTAPCSSGFHPMADTKLQRLRCASASSTCRPKKGMQAKTKAPSMASLDPVPLTCRAAGLVVLLAGTSMVRTPPVTSARAPLATCSRCRCCTHADATWGSSGAR